MRSKGSLSHKCIRPSARLLANPQRRGELAEHAGKLRIGDVVPRVEDLERLIQCGEMLARLRARKRLGLLALLALWKSVGMACVGRPQSVVREPCVRDLPARPIAGQSFSVMVGYELAAYERARSCVP